MLALTIGVLVALAAVALVMDPLVRPAAARPPEPALESETDPLQHRKELALAALKEIEFDRATGKLDDADYERMKQRYTAEALDALRAEDSARAPVEPVLAAIAAGGGEGDAAEVLVAAKRKAGGRFCTECGARLEGSGKFCVECGAKAA